MHGAIGSEHFARLSEGQNPEPARSQRVVLGALFLVFFAVAVVFAFLGVFFALLVFLVVFFLMVLLTLSTSEIVPGSSNRSRRMSSSGMARSRKKRTSLRRTPELSESATRFRKPPVRRRPS